MVKVLLKGFYGFGNFGDDILMIATYRIIKETFPKSQIFVSSESKNSDYIHSYIRDVEIVNSTVNLKVDWTIHGGGGVYFDFGCHSARYILLNQAIKFAGYSVYRTLYNIFRRTKGHGIIEQKFRAGFGIGVGTYTQSSNRFFSDILSLSSFDILLVRDDESVVNAKKYNSSGNIFKSSDLAFLRQHWMPAALLGGTVKEFVGFILRDWIYNDNVSVLLDVAREMQVAGHCIKFFALDPDCDSRFIMEASQIAPVLCWEPSSMTIEDYLGEVSTCKLVISSRAHGAIVAACLGIPVCCVCIEPKLYHVAKMLINSSRIIQEPFATDVIRKVIDNALSDLSLLQASTSRDVAVNHQEMSEGISLFKDFVRKKQSLE